MKKIGLMRALIHFRINNDTFEMNNIIEENKVNLRILANLAPFLNQIRVQQRSGACEFALDMGVLYNVFPNHAPYRRES